MKKHVRKLHGRVKKHVETVKSNPWILVSLFFGFLLVLAAFRYNVVHDLTAARMSKAELKQGLEKYIETYLTQGQDVTIENITELPNRVYMVSVDVAGQKIESYVTDDGKLFFPYGYRVVVPETSPAEMSRKAARPDVKLFIMSYCPYGLQMTKAILPVVDLLKDKADISMHYVIYSNYGNECLGENNEYCSLHGAYELEEDIRQMCVRKLYGNDTFWKYMDMFSHEGSYENKTYWTAIVQKLGLDRNAIDQCVEQEKASQEMLAAELSLNQQFGVRGSPTLIINGEKKRVARSPEAVKKAICDAFENPPEECNTELSATQEAPGFGGGSSSGSAASCGG